MSKPALVPCKFCDEKEDLEVMDCTVCWVECNTCKCRGPVSMLKEVAIKNWNGENKELGKKK